MGAAGVGIRDLIEAHSPGLYRYGYRLSGSATDAEDLVQETFGKAVARLDQLRDPERAKSWLYRILRNAYLHKVRDQKRHKTVSLEAVGDLPTDDGTAIDSRFGVDPARLQEALNDLDETFRTPLILFYFEDFSYRDIAGQLDLPIGTVMSRLARAKAYLRSRLVPEDSAADGTRRTPDAL